MVVADINLKNGLYYNLKHMSQTVVVQFCKKLATRFDNIGNPMIEGK